jgi:hypothetical protein
MHKSVTTQSSRQEQTYIIGQEKTPVLPKQKCNENLNTKLHNLAKYSSTSTWAGLQCTRKLRLREPHTVYITGKENVD